MRGDKQSSETTVAANELGSTEAAPARRGLVGVFLLSVAIGITILWVLISIAGPWDIIAATRLLDLFIEGGIVQYHDRNPGFIAGIPEVKYYYMAQDPIDWRLVAVAAFFMTLYPLIKSIQFDRIARLYGSRATPGEHIRAFNYGDGLDRFLPFNIGRVGSAVALTKLGMSREQAAAAVFLSQVFTIFEVAAFALIGLSLLGWTAWFSQMFWALLFLAAAYYFVVYKAEMSVVPPLKETVRAAQDVISALARQQPGVLVQLCVMSLLAFGAFDAAVYFLMGAFDTAVVLINVEPSVLLMGIVGGYIAARLVPITPGGIGVWELGFATGLHLGGSDVSLSLVSVAVLTNVLRMLCGVLVMTVVVSRFDVKTNLREVIDEFSGEAQPADALLRDAWSGEREPASDRVIA